MGILRRAANKIADKAADAVYGKEDERIQQVEQALKDAAKKNKGSR